MSDAKRTLKQKAIHEAWEYLIVTLYLFIVFSLFVIYKSVIRAEDHLNFALHGFAVINALALGKVMLVAHDLHLADQFREAPLIYPTLLKSFVFTIVLASFKILEDAALGMFHGKSFYESVSNPEGGSWKEYLIFMGLFFVMLIPFFAFAELRRILGADHLGGAFFRSRHLLNRLPTGS